MVIRCMEETLDHPSHLSLLLRWILFLEWTESLSIPIHKCKSQIYKHMLDDSLGGFNLCKVDPSEGTKIKIIQSQRERRHKTVVT